MGKGDKRRQTFSSAKAAEALQASGARSGFGGFSGATPTAGGFAFGAKYVGQVAAAVPSAAAAGSSSGGDASGGMRAAAAAIIPADLDGELAQQLQKLSKRDATTKLKALQALKALAKEKPLEELQAALPSWAYAFGRLVMDGNRGVRAEACHVTASLATAVGRGIAPLLKSLLPPLWLAQHDGYSEAAAAAQGALAAAFPTVAKQRDALLFCRAEVLQLLGDNLAASPQSLGDAKKESPEELADRHERVLSASCAALAALLEVALSREAPAGAPSSGAAASVEALPAAEQELLDGVRAQLEAPAFYKAVLHSKSGLVRRAAYSLVGAAAERCPALLAGSVAVGAPAVLGALGDKEPGNHEAMWGMLLAYARSAPDSWHHISLNKAFLPRLWALLRHGCYGSAPASYPALLPLISLLPQDVLGPRPALFTSLLESLWQGLPALGSDRRARAAAADAFQDCLLYALLKSEQLAAVGGGSSEAAAAAPETAEPPAEAQPPATAQQQYCSELLQAAVGQLLMPAVAASAASPDAAAAPEAEAVLTGIIARLGQRSATAASRERLEQLLQLVGSSLAAALRQALGAGVQPKQEQPQQGGSASEVCERAAALVAALGQAAGPDASALLGAAVAQPVVALLLPEVRSGAAPPAASSLLASLLKAFPQHAAADAAGGSRPESPSAAAGATAGVTGEFTSLRLHQSASFTIDSVVRRLVEDGEQRPEAAAASCDLLLSCLPQVHQPARKLADLIQQLLQPQRQAAASAALLLLERLVSGQHAELAAASSHSAELDKAAAALVGSSEWLAGGDAGDSLTPQVLVVLLAGDGRASLLSEAAQAAVLAQLLQQLQGAAEVAEAAGSRTAEAAPAAAPVMQVVQGAVLSRALDNSGSDSVQALRLQLLAAVLSLLLHDAAADAQQAAEAAASADGSDHNPSTFLDDSEQESVEVPQQLGVAAAAARQLWQQQAGICSLLGAAPEEQQAAFAGRVRQAVESTLCLHASAAAAAAAADVVGQLLLPALRDSGMQQQLLQGLLQQQPAAEDAADSSSSGGSSSSSGCSVSQAVFLATAGAAAGFEVLLPPSQPHAAAEAAVGILGALEADPAAASTQQHQLQRFVADTEAGTLLQPALATAAAAAPNSPRHAAVLCALLQQAMGSGAGVAAVASWFAAASEHLAPALLLRVLSIAAPALRSSDALLQQSGLSQLSQQLCQQCAAAEPAALAAGNGQSASLQLLQAAVACFPCTTGAEAAAQLPSPAAATAAGQLQAGARAGDASTSFSKSDAVWYCQQDGNWAEADVVAVDLALQPPSYSIQLGGDASSLRETEAGRLCARQPDVPAPPSAAQRAAAAAAAAASAAEKRAAAGAAMRSVGGCTAEEQVALLQVLQHQVRGIRAAAAAARAEAGVAGDVPRPGAAALAPPVAAAVAQLLHSSVAFCSQQLSAAQWAGLLEQLRSAFAQCTAALAAAVVRVAQAVCAAAGEIAAGADMASPAVAIQFFRRLKLKGVLDRSAKAQAEAARVAASLEAELALLDAQLAPQLLPALQAYTRAAVAAGSRGTSAAESDWQVAEASMCSDVLQLFVSAGCLAAAAGVAGRRTAAGLSGWLGGPLGEEGLQAHAALWQLLSQHVATTLREADRAFLLAAVDRANAAMDATGVDALGALLALCLSGIPPPGMAAAAFAAVLQHPELTASLTAAEGVDEEALEEQQQQAGGTAAGDSGDAAAMLEQVGVRPELAAALAGGAAGGSGFFSAWALLLAHVLAAPTDSHGRRLLAQSVKEAHSLVPGLIDALVPLLPLELGGSCRRRDSSGGAASGSTPGAGGAGAAAAAAAGITSPGVSGSFASQLVTAGPFPAGHAGELSPAEQQAARRFAALLYAAVLQALPASARLWFTDLRDRGTAAATERYTAGAVSGLLLAAELAAVTEAARAFGKFDKFSVRANATSREVIAVMEVEDGHLLELAVKLPASMPLRPPELECRRKVGVSEGRLRKWLLSISAFLRMQNGSVAEAISLWKRNVDKEFEGQEECLICYSIIQPTSGQLPRLSCRTCRKRFHGGCLYKWFKSSGKSNCPHCQSPVAPRCRILLLLLLLLEADVAAAGVKQDGCLAAEHF